MAEYIFLMHGDADDEGSWETYLQTLKKTGSFEGDSAIGDGILCAETGSRAARALWRIPCRAAPSVAALMP